MGRAVAHRRCRRPQQAVETELSNLDSGPFDPEAALAQVKQYCDKRLQQIVGSSTASPSARSKLITALGAAEYTNIYNGWQAEHSRTAANPHLGSLYPVEDQIAHTGIPELPSPRIKVEPPKGFFGEIAEGIRFLEEHPTAP